ncbi:sensor histidine kinase [Anaerosporobacter faecicola]|uniref:sensor histidine kinase n=1 Tax=Anaerosporobacter faecicola TaxID=2718714 RepID=UPI00143B6CAD|nr:sensor histidine kinase [Anaerosporobacter faecicola]
MVRKGIKWISKAMDNVKIPHKLVILFICCVLIPIVTTNCALYYIVSKKAELERITEMKNAKQRLEYNISVMIDAATSVANQFKEDQVLNNFLDTTYGDRMEYYTKYYKLMQDNVFSYYYQSESVYKISIFTNNTTITRSSSFYPLSDVVEEPWYEEVVGKDKEENSLQFYYSNPVIKNPYDAYTSRKISIFSKFNDYGLIRKYLKVDISYIDMERLVFNEKSFQDILIVCDGKILFDTRNGRLEAKPFSRYEPMKSDLLQVEEPMRIFGQEWKVILIAEKKPFFDNFLDNRVLLGLTILINLVIPCTAIKIIGKSLKDRIRITEDYIKELKDGKYQRIDCYEGKDEIGCLIHSYNMMVLRIQELIEVVLKGNAERQKLIISKKEAELQALQSQVNPHFIFNTLESIRMKSLLNGEEETANIIGTLALHMRRTIGWGDDLTTVGEEIAFLKGYLEIQKYRFGDRMDYSIHVQEECKAYHIPKFGILTFVENACIHGIEKKSDGGRIDVIIMKEGVHYFIEIMDNGIGIEENRLKQIEQLVQRASIDTVREGNNIGILNSFLRLFLYFQGNVEFQIESKQNEGTEVYIVLPCEEEKEEQNAVSNDC